MKLPFNKRRLFVPLTVSILSIAFYYGIHNLDTISKSIGFIIGLLAPFIWGTALAYILWAPLRFFERSFYRLCKKMKKNPNQKHVRVGAVILLYVIVFAVITLLFTFIIPQFTESITTFSNNMTNYYEVAEKTVLNILDQFSLKEDAINFTKDFLQDAWNQLKNVISTIPPMIVSVSVGVTNAVINLLAAVVISIYMLIGKEDMLEGVKRLFYAYLPKKFLNKFYAICLVFNNVFRKYITGQCTDAIIVGILCFVSMTILKFPYALLISTIVMCTNVIPYIGPIIGAVPGMLIIMITGGLWQSLGFLCFILILQQIDGNILVPKIVGKSIGVSGFWVLFAIIVGGGLFGIVGVLLGVPAISSILKIVQMEVDQKIEKQGKKLQEKTIELDEK